MATKDSKRDQDKTDERARDQDRQDKADGNQVPDPTVVEENPDLDPNAPGIDEVERNRRREELTRRQG
jgi:hypothetical protein